MTLIVGTFAEGTSASTTAAFTVPTGVTAGMWGLFAIGTGSSTAVTMSLAGTGGTFTQLDIQTDGQQRAAVFKGVGLVAGTVVTVTFSSSVTSSIGHLYQDEYTYDTLSGAIRSLSATSTTTGSVTPAAGQRVAVVGIERSTAGPTSVTLLSSSGGETVTQESFGDGGTIGASCFLGSFVASAAAARTVSITYTNGSTNGYAALILTTPVSSTPGTSLYPLAFPDGTAYPVIGASSSVQNVTNSAGLTSALSAAAAGHRIVLADGTYSGTFTLSSKTGNSGSGISIEAANPLGAVFAAGSTLVINNCAHVTVKGLDFPFDPPSGDGVISLEGTTTFSRITRCRIGPTSRVNSSNSSSMLYAEGTVNKCRIDHNELRNKGTSGNGIRIYGDFTASGGCRYIRVDHNLIRNSGDETGNDKEPIRVGTSAMSRTLSYNVVERNYITDCSCEPEVISNKLSNMRVTGNRIQACAGGLVVRHGRTSVVADNYILDPSPGTTASAGLKSGGIRFYDSGHAITRNYVSGTIGTNFEAALIIDTGDAEVDGTDALSAHWRVKNATVTGNVLVDTLTGIRIGDNYSQNPDGVTLSDNLAANTGSGQVVTSVNGTTLGGASSQTNNVYGATPGAVSLLADADGIYRRTGYGPRLTLLTLADVGTTGDLTDTDGTGPLLGSAGGGGSLVAAAGAANGATAALTIPPRFFQSATASASSGATSSLTVSEGPRPLAQLDDPVPPRASGWRRAPAYV